MIRPCARFPIAAIISLLVFTALACSSFAPAATPVPSPTATLADTATATQKPTFTPPPTRTPNLAATQEMADVMTQVQKFVDGGYLPSTEGHHYALDDLEQTMAKIDYYDAWPTGQTPENFAVWTDLEWDVASSSANLFLSGCGFMFHFTDWNSNYLAYLTLDGRVRAFANTGAGYPQSMGQAQMGMIGVPGKANFALVVSGEKFDVFVNGAHAKSFFGSKGKVNNGDLAYMMVSGTNKDYGTRCKWTNGHLWTYAP